MSRGRRSANRRPPRPRSGPPSGPLDRQVGVHPERHVPGHRAVELVVPGLQVPGRLADVPGHRDLHAAQHGADHLACCVQSPDPRVVHVLSAVPELDQHRAGGDAGARRPQRLLLRVDQQVRRCVLLGGGRRSRRRRPTSERRAAQERQRRRLMRAAGSAGTGRLPGITAPASWSNHCSSSERRPRGSRR